MRLQCDCVLRYHEAAPAGKRKRTEVLSCLCLLCLKTDRSDKRIPHGTDKEGNPGYYDILHPNYTIFHEDDHTFSDVWTGYTEDFKTFYKNMRDDMETYKDVKAVKAKPGQPQNFYCISMVPWLNFTGYSAYTESGTPMLFPIITCGKFTEHDGILTMPFCVNIAHAAADGYHTSMFINELQKLIDMIEL